MMRIQKLKLTPARVLTLGFAVIILFGSLLLTLPAANRDGMPIPFLNALFTACSATCVTGLVVYDTWSQFSLFGKVVILMLIQTGGLGFMTFAVLFSSLLGKRVGLSERINFSEAVGYSGWSGVTRLARRILTGTLLLEASGALLLFLRFRAVFPTRTALWYGVFHAVSAFCNAGFDLMGRLEPYSSLIWMNGDAVVVLTVMLLIVCGGLGFIVWNDVAEKKLRFRRYALHTKIVLVFTAAAVLLAAALFLFTEQNGVFAELTGGERVLNALFCAVTPRTAGFNTVDVASMSESGRLLTGLLMLVGAGSGSTAGGVKINTCAILALAVFAYVARRPEVNLWGRQVNQQTVRKAFCTVLLYLAMVLTGCLVITAAQGFPVADALFECLSALGTVGLSVGVSGQLSDPGKIIIILLMYAGRVGSLTVFMAMAPGKDIPHTRYPEEEVPIG